MASRQGSADYFPAMKIILEDMLARYPVAMANYSWTYLFNTSTTANICSAADDFDTISTLLDFYKKGKLDLPDALTVLFIPSEFNT